MRKLFSLRILWLLIVAAAISWAGASLRDMLVAAYPQYQYWLSRLMNAVLVIGVGCFSMLPIASHFGINDKDKNRADDDSGEA